MKLLSSDIASAVPQTLDQIPIYLTIGAVALVIVIGFGILIIKKSKKDKDKKE